MDKMAQMQLPDNVYNWIKDFFDDHYHCTKYSGEVSTVAEVKASVIQGSGLGPASFMVIAADLADRPRREPYLQVCWRHLSCGTRIEHLLATGRNHSYPRVGEEQ